MILFQQNFHCSIYLGIVIKLNCLIKYKCAPLRLPFLKLIDKMNKSKYVTLKWPRNSWIHKSSSNTNNCARVHAWFTCWFCLSIDAIIYTNAHLTTVYFYIFCCFCNVDDRIGKQSTLYAEHTKSCAQCFVLVMIAHTKRCENICLT